MFFSNEMQGDTNVADLQTNLKFYINQELCSIFFMPVYSDLGTNHLFDLLTEFIQALDVINVPVPALKWCLT